MTSTSRGDALPQELDPRRYDFADDPYRPAYHFVAPANLLKDANGCIQWDGQYHLLYQYNPDGVADDVQNMHWGHAFSEDLTHWYDLPVAIGPDPDGPDRLGCWSGGAIDVEGVLTLFYFGNPDGVCIAQSHDGMRSFQKHPSNPIIPQAPPDAEWRTFDPCVWREDDGWYALCGGRTPDADTAYLFRSHDFFEWEYVHRLYVGGQEFPAESDCAVPDFFPLGDRHVLLFASHARGGQYYVGDYEEHRFTPTHHGRMNYGEFTLECGNFIAPNTLLDDQGRRIMISWIAEGLAWPDAQQARGWAGIMCVPTVLSLGSDGDLRMDPAPELERLRTGHRTYSDIVCGGSATFSQETAAGDRLEIHAVIELGDAEVVGLSVRRSPDGEEDTRVEYNPAEGTLTLDPSKSSLRKDFVGRASQVAPLTLDPGSALDLRIFVDRSVVEVFANSRKYVCKRIYPSRDDSLGVDVFARGGEAHVVSLDIWDMEAVWPING